MVDLPGSNPEHPQHPEVTEALDATVPARPEAKKELLDLIDEKLKDQKPWQSNPHKRGLDLIVKETNTPISLARWDSPSANPDRLLASVSVIERSVGETGRERHITNYHFREAPDELSVERLSHFSERKVIKKARTIEEKTERHKELLDEIEAMEKTIAEEREAGFTFFSERDAKDLKNLITKAVPRF